MNFFEEDKTPAVLFRNTRGVEKLRKMKNETIKKAILWIIVLAITLLILFMIALYWISLIRYY